MLAPQLQRDIAQKATPRAKLRVPSVAPSERSKLGHAIWRRSSRIRGGSPILGGVKLGQRQGKVPSELGVLRTGGGEREGGLNSGRASCIRISPAFSRLPNQLWLNANASLDGSTPRLASTGMAPAVAPCYRLATAWSPNIGCTCANHPVAMNSRRATGHLRAASGCARVQPVLGSDCRQGRGHHAHRGMGHWVPPLHLQASALLGGVAQLAAA